MTDSSAADRRRRVRRMQRYFLNPPIKFFTWLGLTPGLVLIETRGRRTGKRRRNVVGMLVDGDTGWVVAEQGPHAGWVANVNADAVVRVRRGRHWKVARAVVVPDDDARARLDSFGRRSHAAAVRKYGTALTSVRFEFGHS